MATWVDKIPKNKFPEKPAIAKAIAGFLLEKSTARLCRAQKRKKELMNINYRKVPTRFGPETRFEVEPVPPVPFRETEETALERLKNRLLREFLYEDTETRAYGYVRRAANEAAALAWITRFPLLVFPALFEEKAEAARIQARRQECVRLRSLDLLAV